MVSFNNCYFLHRDKGWSELNTVKGAIFSNNVFLQEKYFCYSEDVNEFHNNLFVEGMTETELPAQVLSNNIYNYPIDSIFVGGNSFNTYKENFDYHLRQEVLDIIQGSDGTAIGIYGTAYPFKDGALPYNPHISFKSIAPSTNAEGKIKVNIKVSAQDR
ncbi:MAG: hypothetical protein KA792_08220 [Bacteroidales bacterium]|nr:hypothetical protein [Bacteroidales bacterium]